MDDHEQYLKACHQVAEMFLGFSDEFPPHALLNLALTIMNLQLMEMYPELNDIEVMALNKDWQNKVFKKLKEKRKAIPESN